VLGAQCCVPGAECTEHPALATIQSVVSIISRILLWARRRRALMAIAAVGLAALSLVGIRRLAFDTDVLSLLPRDGRVIPAFRTFIQNIGSLDDVYVVFAAPEGQAIGDFDVEIGAWIERLRRAPEIVRVDSGLLDSTRDLGWLANRQLLLLDDRRLEQALQRFSSQDMQAAIASRRALLALPSAEIAGIVRQDPLGFGDLVRDQLGSGEIGVNLGMAQGGYVTPDGRSRLVIARPARPPYDTEFSRALMATLERIRIDVASMRRDGRLADEPPGLHVELAGGHRIAVETEAIVRRESILNTIGSLALILPLLFLVFRSLWLVGVGPLPAALALAAVLGTLGFAGATLSAAATASAAMLFGLGMDGVVVLYVAHTVLGRIEAGDSGDRLAGPAVSMLLGMWTTAATFYGLTFVDFPSLQQLGALIGHSMVLCGLFTLLIVPALLPTVRSQARRAPRVLLMPGLARWIDRRRRTIHIGAVIVTVVLGAAAFTVRINPTLDRLRSATPAASRLERIFADFQLPHDVYVVVQQGPELESLLRTNERIAGEVSRTLPAVRLQPATSLLPSRSAQEKRAASVAQASPSADEVGRSLARAAEAEGFTADAFAPFVARLPQLLATDQRLSVEGYAAHGLADLLERFVVRQPDGWLVVSYATPSSEAEIGALRDVVAKADASATLTGLPLVNRELAERFLPEFVKGLAIGSAISLILLVAVLRDWRLSLLALVPAVVGLVWAAGVLALARIELDLFALFAVVTFVGIGVDYGIHLVHRYRERGHAAHAVEELAPVILVAAAITLLGYGTLVASSYPPLSSIGLVSIVAVIMLAAASLLVLPAILPRVDDTDGHVASAFRRKAAGGVHLPALREPQGRPEPSRGTAAGSYTSTEVMRTVAVIPAFNEAATIQRVVDGLRGVVDHVMVVDDGSTDDTTRLARESGAEVIAHSTNRGKGYAIRSAIETLAPRDFTHVLLLDGDMQHLPSEAGRLIEAAATGGADLVLGERRFDRSGMPASRYHANRWGSLALSWFVGVPLRDTQCGFRVVRMASLSALPLGARGYEIETEMLVKLWRRGARMASVPVSAVYNGQASKLRPVRDTTRTCFLAVYYRYIERL
jgi:uncharacterized protein